MYWDVVEVKPEPSHRLFIRFKDGLARNNRSARMTLPTEWRSMPDEYLLPYLTETVRPAWLLTPPIEMLKGSSPPLSPGGICAFTCITPETMPGASPKNVTAACWPPIVTLSGSAG